MLPPGDGTKISHHLTCPNSWAKTARTLIAEVLGETVYDGAGNGGT